LALPNPHDISGLVNIRLGRASAMRRARGTRFPLTTPRSRRVAGQDDEGAAISRDHAATADADADFVFFDRFFWRLWPWVSLCGLRVRTYAEAVRGLT